MADLFSTQSPFIDKAADEADLERKSKIDLATIGAVSKAMGSAGAAGASDSPFQGASASTAPAPTPQQMGVTPAAPAAAPMDAFTKLLQDTDPSLKALQAKAVAGANQQFDNPAAAFDQGASISREDLGRTIQSARDAQREDLIKTYGPNASQVLPQLGNFDQNAILQSRDLNRRLTADRATASSQGVTTAIQNAMGILGQQSQDQLGKAGLQLNAINSTEQSRQFEKGLTTQISEADKNRQFAAAENSIGRTFTTSEREAVQAFQSVQQKGAQDFAAAEAALGRTFTSSEREAIQAYQTSERIGSQVYASAEADLGRKFTTGERTAIQDFQQAQRLGAQDFQSAEAVLGRKFTSSEREAIQTYQTNERLSAQDFTSIMTEKGYVHDNQLEIMRENLQKELQATGISADQAKQQADQKFQELTQQREQGFIASQADLTQKWNTNERIDTQDWQKGIQANEFRQQDALAKLQNLSQEAIAKGSWDNASKLQAEQLLAQATEAEKARSAQYLMFSAQQAQEDGQFALEFGLKQEEVKAGIENAKTQLGLAVKQLGITEEQWAINKDDAQFNKDMELAQYGLEMWNGENEEALKPFITKLATTMGKNLGMDATILEQAISSKFTSTAATGTMKAGFDAFDSTIDKLGGFASPDAAEAFKTYAKTIATAFASAPAGVKVGLNAIVGADMDAAANRLKSLGAKHDDSIIDMNQVSGGPMNLGTRNSYSGIPEFANYTIYTKLLGSLSEGDAYKALVSLVGADKAKAAVALEKKK